jgi:hypothetical protein
MAIIRILLFVLAALSVQAFAAVDCRDVNKVAKEAVAYSLVGAYTPFTSHGCFKHEKFRYFRPEKGYPTGEVIDARGMLWFDKSKDSYKIESVKLNKDKKYDIAVQFLIGGRQIHTTYLYDPDPEYAAKTGECGFVVNYEHGIFRKDCVDRSRLPSSR